MTTSTLTPGVAAAGNASTQSNRFGERASDATIARTADALRAKGYAVHVVENGDEAKAVILDLLPEGAEVGQGASTTLEHIGVTKELEESGRSTPCASAPGRWTGRRPRACAPCASSASGRTGTSTAPMP